MKSLIKPLNRLRVVDTKRREPNWKENDEVLQAAGVNDVSALEKLFSKGVDITAARNWNEASTLHIASQRGSCQVVQLLLNVKAKPNIINNVKSTPLHYAASGGHQQIVKLLIDAGALISSKDKDNKTPLHHAANRGHSEVVKLLVDSGATVDAKDKHGNTPLANAVSNNHQAIVKYLINEAKADVSKLNKDMQLRYRSGGQQKCHHGQISLSSQPTPSHSASSQDQQRYIQQQRYIKQQRYMEQQRHIEQQRYMEQQKHIEQQRYIEQQIKKMHIMQRNEQHQRYAAQQRNECMSTSKQQYHSVTLQVSKQQPSSSQQPPVTQGYSQERHSIQLQIGKQQSSANHHPSITQGHSQEKQPNSQEKQQHLLASQTSSTQLQRQSLYFEVKIELQPPHTDEHCQTVQQKVIQKQTQVKQRRSILTSTTSLHDQEESSKQVESQSEGEQLSQKNSLMEEKIVQSVTVQRGQDEKSKQIKTQLNRKQLTQKNSLVEEKTEQSQQKLLVEEAEVVCIEQEVICEDNHDRLKEIVEEKTSTTTSTSDVTDCSSYENDNDETFYENSVATVGINVATEEIQQVTEVNQSSVHKHDSSNDSPAGKHLPFNHSSQLHQPHPQYASQERASSKASVNIHDSSLQKQHPELLPHLPHQQPFNYYPNYQPLYHQHNYSSTLPNHYLPAHHQPPPHHLYRHYTLPASFHYHQPPLTQYPQQDHLLHPHMTEHRSSSPAALEQSSYHHNAVPHINGQIQEQLPYGLELHRASSPAVLEQQLYHNYAMSQINTTQLNVQPTVTGNATLSPQLSSTKMSPSSSPVMSLRQPEQQTAYSNNSPTSPQHIDLQMQELTRRIEELKVQREAYERSLKQDEMYSRQSPHEMVEERKSVTPAVNINEKGCRKLRSFPSDTTEDSLIFNNMSPQLSTASSSEDMSSLSLRSDSDSHMLTHAGKKGRTTPNNLPLQSSPESTVPHTIINSSTPDLDLSSDTASVTSTSNTDIVPLQSNKQQPKCADQIISKLFNNFQTPPSGNMVVQMLFMQDNNIAFSSNQTTDCGEDNHNSLKPFTTDISSTIDVETVVPYMVTNGLLSSSQHEYLLSPYHTSNDKKRKLTCIAVTLNEDCVEKFLHCLEETSNYEPHETLLKKIRNGV